MGQMQCGINNKGLQKQAVDFSYWLKKDRWECRFSDKLLKGAV
jgi:hypothetical protein